MVRLVNYCLTIVVLELLRDQEITIRSTYSPRVFNLALELMRAQQYASQEITSMSARSRVLSIVRATIRTTQSGTPRLACEPTLASLKMTHK